MSAETLDAKLRKHAEDLLLNDPPQTEEELCRVVAEACVAYCDRPKGDGEFHAAAEWMACGLFGDDYKDADTDQKWAWVALCESALRAAWETRPVLN